MIKLLREEFARLWKTRIFHLCCLASVGLSAFCLIMRFTERLKFPDYPQTYTDVMLTCNLYMVFGMAAFVGLFVGTEFSEGTIRNKLMLGHLRSHVYLTEFIVCTVGNLILSAISIGTVFALGYLVIGPPGVSAVMILIGCFQTMAANMAFTAILVFVTIVLCSKAYGSVICLVITIIMLFAVVWANGLLNEPEMCEAHTYFDTKTNELVYEDAEPNPYYVGGTKRKVLALMVDALPAGQYLTILEMDAEKTGIFVLYDGIWMVLLTGAGVWLFRKKDLK